MQKLLARALSGLVAGLAATASMSLAMLAARKLGILGEPPPRRITRKLLGPLLPSGRSLDVASVLTHFAFGGSVGALFSLLPPALQRPGAGAVYGAGVWAFNYAGVLPHLGLMPRARHDRPGRPTSMLAAHLVYGASLGLTYRALRPDPVSLRGKVAVVCGGSRGLGRSLARELLQQGARVAICGRSAESLERTAAWLRQFGEPVLAEVCDLREEDRTRAFVERVTRELGPIDVLIANAATIDVAPLEALQPQDFRAAMHEIFDSALHATFAVLPQMQSRGGGTIALITSVGGRIGVPHLAPYTAAKFAEVGFGEALQAELGKDGVRILTVMPGLMRTGSHLHATFRGHFERELLWFGASATAPLISIDADRAARLIVRAIAAGDRFLTFTPAARLGIWLHDRAPELWSLLSQVAARGLPSARANEAGAGALEGQAIIDHTGSRLLRLLRKRGAKLAERHGQ